MFHITQQPRTKIEELREKYKQTPRDTAHLAFESSRSSRQNLETRLGSAPSEMLSQAPDLAETFSDFAKLEMEFADYVDRHGKLSQSFAELIAAQGVYGGLKIKARLALYALTMQKNRSRNLKLDARRNKGRALESLIGDIAEVYEENHQASILGMGYVKTLQTGVIQHMRYLDNDLIDNLRAKFASSADQAQAENALQQFAKELEDINSTVESYETDILKAKEEGDMGRTDTLTDELTQVLELKRDVLDGRLMAEETERDIRYKILDSAEAVQSARGARAASEVNLIALNQAYDAYAKLEIKYRHAKNHMIPVFKAQGAIAGIGTEIADLERSLLDAALLSDKLMMANERLVTAIIREVSELLKTPTYDVAKANSITDRLTKLSMEVRRNDMEWANSSSVSGMGYGSRA